MSLDTRERLSLLFRTLVSLGVVSVVSLTIVVVAAIVTGGAVFLGIATVFVIGAMVLHPFVEGTFGAQIGRFPSWNVGILATVVGVGFLPALYFRPVRNEIREFEAELGGTGQLATERHPEIATMVRRLSQQAGVPEPTVRIVNRRRPESYALGGRSAGTIIVTRGVIRRLDDDEIEAVLAHELSHLINGDSRIMNLLLVPMLVAERVGTAERPTVRSIHGLIVFSYGFRLLAWAIVSLVTTIQLRLCQLGVALLSRGREVTADSGSAELTGSPSALASALETLDDARGRPDTDLRNFRRSAGTLDILPPEEQGQISGPFRTHPDTETRIERLKAMAASDST